MIHGQQLLAAYVENGSETAFRELVSHYVDLVYSAAMRLVDGDSHLAQDVTQTVFADLARMARSLSKEVMLGGWLHRHTCFVARTMMRGERRRQTRERQAVEMNATVDHSDANLKLIAPILDEAIDQLGAADRRAILLRFFEQRDFRAVGEALGSNEEAARKRVDRAVQKLHALLTRRGITLSTTALATTLATQAVTAAPAGLVVTISSAALAGVAAGSGAASSLTFLNIMSMTKLKVGIISAVVATGIAIPLVMERRANVSLREENASLRQQLQQGEQLSAENERLRKLALQAGNPARPSNDPSPELLRLRGEVGRLRQQSASNAAVSKTTESPLSGLTADPAMRKTIRDTQKMGLGMIYKDLAARLNLPKEQAEQLVDLLADNVMENIDHITALLRDGKGVEQMDAVFSGQEAGLLEKVRGLLGPEGFAQYQEYTRNLASHLTAEQFKGMLTGDAEMKNQKAKQLYRVMQEETQLALANAGRSPDFQVVPNLNFLNFASEPEAEKNLKFLDNIYERVTARSDDFLSPEELAALGKFRTNAINANRMSLSVNRKMMAPSK